MFGFPKYDRPNNFQFKTNFLRSVTLQIKFQKISNIISYKDQFTKVLGDVFPNNQDLQSSKIEIRNINNKTQMLPQDLGVSGIMFNTKDNSQNINISEDTIILNIDGRYYKNLDNLWNTFGKRIEEILNICQITELNWVSLRKINLIQFETKDGFSTMDGIASVFNNALVGSFLSMPGKEYVANCVSSISLKEKEHNISLTVGLIPETDIIKNLLLDIDLVCNKENIEVNTFEQKLFEINQEIFNAFYWSLQENTINQLN